MKNRWFTKTVVIAMLVAGLSTAAFGNTVLKNWQFNEAEGTLTTQVKDSVDQTPLGSKLDGTFAAKGVLHVGKGPAGKNFNRNIDVKKQATGQVELSLLFKAAELQAGAVSFGLRAPDNQTLFLVGMGGGRRLQLKATIGHAAPSARVKVLQSFDGNTLAQDLKVRAVADLDANEVTFFWTLGSGAEQSKTLSLETESAVVAKIQVAASSDSLSEGDYVDVDYLTCSLLAGSSESKPAPPVPAAAPKKEPAAIVSTGETPQTGLNVLFIAIDDINPVLGCYGDATAKSPRMDELAASGTLFMNAHCQFAVCGPSRASIMTSLMPEETGVLAFEKMRSNKREQLSDLVTLPQHFKNQGYETAATGKINDFRCVGTVKPDGTVQNNGASVDDPPSWSIPYAKTGGIQPTRAIREKTGKKVKLAAESVDKPDEVFTDGRICDKGLELLKRLAKGDKPFFLGVGFKKPHLPFLAPKAYWDLYDRDEFTIHPFQTEMEGVTPYTFNKVHELRGTYYLETDRHGKALALTDDILPEEQQKTLLHGYYACVSFVDTLVGRLLDELEEQGLSDNTIVVLWGDHGFHLGDHNEWGKHTDLEQATRVPLMIRAPGLPVGATTQSPTSLIDLYPTLCELAGLPIPEQPLSTTEPTGRPLVGKSLLPILKDPAASVKGGAITHWGYGVYGYAYRTERYRYIEWINNGGTVLARELYDYETDPMETVNLATSAEYKSLMKELSEAMRGEDGAGCDRLNASKGK